MAYLSSLPLNCRLRDSLESHCYSTTFHALADSISVSSFEYFTFLRFEFSMSLKNRKILFPFPQTKKDKLLFPTLIHNVSSDYLLFSMSVNCRLSSAIYQLPKHTLSVFCQNKLRIRIPQTRYQNLQNCKNRSAGRTC